MRASKYEAGFTLIEVLVALLIFSVAIIGLSSASAQSVSHAARIEHKAYAEIIADNALIRARLLRPVVGTKTGKTEAGGRTFNWRVQTTQTEAGSFYQLDVKVFDSTDDQLLMTRTAFLLPEATP